VKTSNLTTQCQLVPIFLTAITQCRHAYPELGTENWHFRRSSKIWRRFLCKY